MSYFIMAGSYTCMLLSVLEQPLQVTFIIISWAKFVILVQNRGKICGDFLFSPQHIPKPRDDACEFEEMRVIREWGGVFEWGCRGKGGGIFESYLESS